MVCIRVMRGGADFTGTVEKFRERTALSAASAGSRDSRIAASAAAAADVYDELQEPLMTLDADDEPPPVVDRTQPSAVITMPTHRCPEKRDERIPSGCYQVSFLLCCQMNNSLVSSDIIFDAKKARNEW